MQYYYTRYCSVVLISNPLSYYGVLQLGNYHLDFFSDFSNLSHELWSISSLSYSSKSHNHSVNQLHMNIQS